MLNVSLAVKHKFNSVLQREIENSLGRKKIFDVIHYYFSFSETSNYTLLFFRGKEATAIDYIRILTKIFKTQGVLSITDNKYARLEFFARGERIFWFQTTHPKEMSLEGKFCVDREGDIGGLKLFKEDLDTETLERKIYGTGDYFFFPRAYLIGILNLLGLPGLIPMLYWDYDSLKNAESRFDSIGALADLEEFGNIKRIQIKPDY